MISFIFLTGLIYICFTFVFYTFCRSKTIKHLYWSRLSRSRLTGSEIARRILEHNRLSHVTIQLDHRWKITSYDRCQKKVRLAPSIYSVATLGAMAITAHECGRAIQSRDTSVGYRLFQVGLAVHSACLILLLVFPSIWLVIVGFAAAVFYSIGILRCDVDASQRGLNSLRQLELIESDEVKPVKKLLQAASLSYIFGLLVFAIFLIPPVASIFNYDSFVFYVPYIGVAIIMLLPANFPSKNSGG
jgi:uncharacterized protein